MYDKMDKEYILNTYAKTYINFQYGKNATLFDENGKDYIDFASGIGVVSVGHGNERLSKTIAKQASKLIHTSNLYLIEPQVRLAKKISELYGSKVATFFANSGAEANEGAIKLARKYGQQRYDGKRYKIATLKNSFHGRTLATLKATGQKSFHKPEFSPYPDGFYYVNHIKDLYNKIDNKTVAVMIELVQGEGGVSSLNKNEVLELCGYLKQKDILLIVDEVQTGIYRTGEFLASNVYGIKPDIITLAKGLSGGLPIGAVLTIHEDLFEIGDHGSTFGGNYLSTIGGCEVLDILEEYKKNGKMKASFSYFDFKLKKFTLDYGVFFCGVVGIGLMRGIRCIESINLDDIVKSALKEGVMVLKSGKNTLRFLPVLTITDKETDKGFERLENVFKKIS